MATALTRVPAQRLDAMVSQLRDLGTTPRFHHASSLSGYEDILPSLIAAEIVWAKEQDGETVVGPNRRYDAPG